MTALAATRGPGNPAARPPRGSPLNGVLSPLLHDLLSSGIAVRLRVTGRSMTPYLLDDDLVTLEPIDAGNIRPGDLVYARQPGLPAVLHRVIDRVRGRHGGWSVQTKGDALATKDPAVDAGHVAGRVVVIRRMRPCGACRELRLLSRRQRVLQRLLALGSRHAPRTFAAISRRLVPRLESLTGWAPPRVTR